MKARVDAERGGNALQQDVGGTERQSGAQGNAHSSLSLLAGKCHADGGQDEGCKGRGETLVVLHLEDLQVGAAPDLLLFDVFLQFAVGHCLLLVAREQEVLGFHHDDRVDRGLVRDFLLHSLQVAYRDVGQVPLVAYVAQRVVLGTVGRQVRDEFLLLELVQGEMVTLFVDAVEMFHKGYDARIDLQLHVVGIRGIPLAGRTLVHVLEVQSLGAAPGYDLGSQVERQGGYDGGAYQIGPYQPAEAHARTLHGYDLAVVRQFRGEEDDADEDEQRAEQVAVIGNEVGIILEDDGRPGGVVRGELVHVLVEIEDHGHANDHEQGKEVGAQELSYQVGVNPF